MCGERERERERERGGGGISFIITQCELVSMLRKYYTLSCSTGLKRLYGSVYGSGNKE